MAVLNKYRLYGGPHIARDITADPLKDEATGAVLYERDKKTPKYPVKKFQAGDIVVSAEDLTQRFPNKFQFAGPYGTSTAHTAPPLAPTTPNAPPPAPIPTFAGHSKADLDAMTITDLRKLAEEEGVDVSAANKKEQIVERLLAAGAK